VGDFAGAKAYLEHALQICRAIGRPLQESAYLSGLSLLSHQLGDDLVAQEYARAALRVAQEVGERSRQAEAWCNLGHAQLGLRQLPEAVEAYGQSLAVRRELAQSNQAMQALAGLAQVALEQDDQASAADLVEEILSHLRTHADSGRAGHAFDGTDEPLRIYLTCYQILKANDDPRAEEVLEEAHDLLEERAAEISDQELRRSFLENVSAHRELVSEWQASSP
jgi:tetratricopeptide (TPR) repeat protein